MVKTIEREGKFSNFEKPCSRPARTLTTTLNILFRIPFTSFEINKSKYAMWCSARWYYFGFWSSQSSCTYAYFFPLSPAKFFSLGLPSIVYEGCRIQNRCLVLRITMPIFSRFWRKPVVRSLLYFCYKSSLVFSFKFLCTYQYDQIKSLIFLWIIWLDSI